MFHNLHRLERHPRSPSASPAPPSPAHSPSTAGLNNPTGARVGLWQEADRRRRRPAVAGAAAVAPRGRPPNGRRRRRRSGPALGLPTAGLASHSASCRSVPRPLSGRRRRAGAERVHRVPLSHREPFCRADLVAVLGGSTSGHWRASRGTHTANKSPKSQKRSTSCLRSGTDSQAGRRRFDPGRPLSLRAVTRQGFFVWLLRAAR